MEEARMLLDGSQVSWPQRVATGNEAKLSLSFTRDHIRIKVCMQWAYRDGGRR